MRQCEDELCRGFLEWWDEDEVDDHVDRGEGLLAWSTLRLFNNRLWRYQQDYDEDDTLIRVTMPNHVIDELHDDIERLEQSP